MITIDLNADLGEGFGRWPMGDDHGLLGIITSANVACGFHAGDPSIMRDVTRRAADNGVAIGAHIGYRDLFGFGRRDLDIGPDDLLAESVYQIGALDAFAHRAGDRVRYVKPHGALYHAASRDRALADAIVTAIAEHGEEIALLGPRGSQLETSALASGVPFAAEGFADRRYDDSGTLVSRSRPDAVHSRVDDMIGQARSIVLDHAVTSTTGAAIDLEVRSLCVHGDTPGSVQAARSIRTALESSGVTLRSFA
jgi:UPF0271 protein